MVTLHRRSPNIEEVLNTLQLDLQGRKKNYLNFLYAFAKFFERSIQIRRYRKYAAYLHETLSKILSNINQLEATAQLHTTTKEILGLVKKLEQTARRKSFPHDLIKSFEANVEISYQIEKKVRHKLYNSDDLKAQYQVDKIMTGLQEAHDIHSGKKKGISFDDFLDQL